MEEICKLYFVFYGHKFENFDLLKCSFYKLQAYHVELNTDLGWLQARPTSKKNRHL